MASVDNAKQPNSTTPPSPIDLPQPQPPPLPAAANISAPAIRSSQSYLAHVAFLILAALTSAPWSVEQFAAAAANLRLPMPAVVAVVIGLLFAGLFYTSVHFFRSFFLARPPVAAAMLQWERFGAIAAVGTGFALASSPLADSRIGTSTLQPAVELAWGGLSVVIILVILFTLCIVHFGYIIQL